MAGRSTVCYDAKGSAHLSKHAARQELGLCFLLAKSHGSGTRGARPYMPYRASLLVDSICRQAGSRPRRYLCGVGFDSISHTAVAGCCPAGTFDVLSAGVPAPCMASSWQHALPALKAENTT